MLKWMGTYESREQMEHTDLSDLARQPIIFGILAV